ncbi:MAG TPA: winged helix-turn-helix domain-containing protein, partial [Firmicutes bacterium]|nr:winged helix-turn-helix domain-containing protein [Bacillota bacterium]
MPAELSRAQVRRAAIHCQLLDGRKKLGRGLAALDRLVERMGYVQIDTISVVERAHHHTAWARLPACRPGWLERLQDERRVFEYWGHAASYLPLADYRFYLPAMQRYREDPHHWAAEQQRRHKEAIEAVHARIRTDGPLSAQDFETPEKGRGPWWDWKPAKAALEVLFWQGELMISGRRGFQRVYDLTERVLPPDVDTTMPSREEWARFLVTRALNAYGVAREYDIRFHIKADQHLVNGGIRAMLTDGSVVEVQVEGEGRMKYYALADRLDGLVSLRAVKPRLHILSPFDNLV